MADKVDEGAFTPWFLASLTDRELVVLQHDLRQFVEDRPYLGQVLAELKRRESAASKSVAAPTGREEG